MSNITLIDLMLDVGILKVRELTNDHILLFLKNVL